MSAYGQTINPSVKADETDTCLFDFTRHTFPQKWEQNAIDFIYWFTSISNFRYYESLSSTPQQKLDILPQEEFTDPYYLVDSAYYCKTLYSTKTYTLSIYKNGSKYQSWKVDEKFDPVDYLLLVALDTKQRIIDYLVCYYYVYRLYESAERYFYIDNNKNIVLANFYSDELETTFEGKCTYHINDQGRFTLTEKVEGIKDRTK